MVLGEILAKDLSVRETEKLVARYQEGGQSQNQKQGSSGKKSASSQKSADINRIEQQLRSVLGVKVELQYQENGSGQIRIPFRTDKELNYILDLLEDLDSGE